MYWCRLQGVRSIVDLRVCYCLLKSSRHETPKDFNPLFPFFKIMTFKKLESM